MSEDALAKLRVLRARVANAATAGGRPVDPSMAAYLDKVARHAYKITDEEVHALLAAGRSQDEIFEATVLVAIDSATAQLEAGLAALAHATTEAG